MRRTIRSAGVLAVASTLATIGVASVLWLGQSGTGPAKEAVTDVTLTNTSSTPTVGFFLRADIRRGTTAGTALPGDNEVLPVTWSNDDLTLWPGESETLTATYRQALLEGSKPVVSVFGWNLRQTTVSSG